MQYYLFILLVLYTRFYVLQAEVIHTTTTLNQMRFDLSATYVGQYALFAGGRFGDNVSNIVDVFDSEKLLWSTITLTQPRHNIASTSVGGYAFFAGGTAYPNIYHSVVDIFNASLHLSTAYLSQGRRHLAATSVGSYALFGGGMNKDAPLDVVDIFNSSIQQWSTATLSQARAYLAATSVGRYALFAGGLDGYGNSSNVVDIFDSVTYQWSTATLSYARYYIAATSAGRYALFAGGVGDSIATSSVVDIFDSETLQWSTTTMSAYSRYSGATVDERYALFAGGQTMDSGYPSTTIDVFDALTLQWSQLERGSSEYAESYYQPSGTSVAHFALFANVDIIDIYHYEEDTQPPNSTPSSAPSSAPTSQSSIVVLEDILNGVIQPDTAANIQPDGLIDLTLEPGSVTKLNSGTSCELSTKKRHLIIHFLIITAAIVYVAIPLGRAIIYRIRQSFLPEQVTTTQNERYDLLEMPFKISCSTAKRSTNIVESTEDNTISYVLHHNSSNIIFGVGFGNQLLGYYAIEVEDNSFIGNVSISFGYNATAMSAPSSSDPTPPLSTPKISGANSVMTNSLFATLCISMLAT